MWIALRCHWRWLCRRPGYLGGRHTDSHNDPIPVTLAGDPAGTGICSSPPVNLSDRLVTRHQSQDSPASDHGRTTPPHTLILAIIAEVQDERPTSMSARLPQKPGFHDDAGAPRHVGGSAGRRARLLVLAAVGLCTAIVALAPASTDGAGARPSPRVRGGTAPRATLAPPSSYAVGLRVIPFVDTSRRFVFRRKHKRKRVPRTMLTEVLYPAVGTPGATDMRDAPAASLDGPFPLVVFGHGFDATPAVYARLLHSWAQAGYVVAAPTFPGENPAAPGGPTESDIINEPGDMSFVISRMLAANTASGPLSQLIDPSLIAVAGHSDGAEVALAVAYAPRFRDPRVRAAIILSGAEIEPKNNLKFPIGGPPLLATEGTADKVNLPKYPYHFFKAARPPKYLLRLLGAGHLPPYTTQEPELGIVERVSLAFLDAYLKQTPGALAQLRSDGNVPGYASLQPDP